MTGRYVRPGRPAAWHAGCLPVSIELAALAGGGRRSRRQFMADAEPQLLERGGQLLAGLGIDEEPVLSRAVEQEGLQPPARMDGEELTFIRDVQQDGIRQLHG